jgi:hypothetical protein
VALPDAGDSHVVAAAVAAEATILCTSNIRDFPIEAIDGLGFAVQTPDDLLCLLMESDQKAMISVHSTVMADHQGADDALTLQALRKAGAPNAAEKLAYILLPKSSAHSMAPE